MLPGSHCDMWYIVIVQSFGMLWGYPYCGKNDHNIGKPGQSIKRPKKGFGRFSGKYMHSANHTKRITDSRAYARNLEQLKEIGSGGGRWKTDGLNSLAFSIVDSQEDRADQDTQHAWICLIRKTLSILCSTLWLCWTVEVQQISCLVHLNSS